MWARVTSPGTAAFYRAPVAGRRLALLAESAPGGSGSVLGTDVAPPTAQATVGVRSHLLVGIDLVTAALNPHPSLAEASEDCLS